MSRNAIGASRQTPQHNARHEPWCDAAQHAQALAEAHPDEQAKIGCIGRDFVIPTDGKSKLCGQWIQPEPGREPVFSMEWAPHQHSSKHWSLTLPELEVVEDILLSTDAAGLGGLQVAVARAVGDRVHGRSSECPLWCARHELAEEGTPDEFVVHVAEPRRAGGYEVVLRRTDPVQGGGPGSVEVYLGGEPMSEADAAALGALLTVVAS